MSESRMREICTSGSMSREWKRIVWQAPQARRTTPRHFLTLPTSVGGSWDEAVIREHGSEDRVSAEPAVCGPEKAD
ncbi:MAG: hypothetical protein ACSLE1_02840 [Sphingobium sp.]